MDDELKAKKDSDKKRNTLIVIAVLAPFLFISLIIGVAIVIGFNSMISPLQKATEVIKVNIGNIFEEGSAENLFEKMKEFASLKGNYKNNNAMQSTEYKFYEEVYKVSKIYPLCGNEKNKERAMALVMSTLFYEGNIDNAMNSDAQNYPDLDDENLDGENNVVELEKDDPSKIYSDDDFEENAPTKEIKKLYKKACKGYGEYQQYLVDTYIQKYYPDLLDIEDKEIRDYKIAKIGEEIVFSADNYIRMLTTADDEPNYIIDYDTYKIRMPRSSHLNINYGDLNEGITESTIFWGEYVPNVGYNDSSYKSWKQMDSRWANLALSNFETREEYEEFIKHTSVSQGMVGPYGCYATSISIAIKMMDENGISKLNRDYLNRYYNGKFDPGVLVSEVGSTGGFALNSDLIYQRWGNISDVTIGGDIPYYCNTSNYANQSEFIDIANEVENGKPVILHLNTPHFVTVTGVIKDGNGRVYDLEISDPGTQYTYTFSQHNYCSRLVGYRKVY